MKIPMASDGRPFEIRPSPLPQTIGNGARAGDDAAGQFIRILDASIGKSTMDRPALSTGLDRIKLQQLIELVQLQLHQTLVDSLMDGGEEGELSAMPDLMPFSSPGMVMSVPVPENQKPSGSQGDTSSKQAYDDIIARAASSYGIDPALISSVIRAESGFDPDAISPKGAMGLMQLMPDTARELGVKNPYDPEENIMAGTHYLRSLLDRYDGNVTLALAAYNWGMGNVERNPNGLPRETRGYIARVTRYYQGTET